MSDAEARLTTLEIVRRWPLRNVLFSETDLFVLRSIYTWRDCWHDFGFILWFLNPKKLLAWLCGVLCRTCRRHDCGCLQYDMTITSVPVMAMPRSNLRTYDQASINAQLDEMELAIEHANRDIQGAIQKMDRVLMKWPRI